MAGYHPAVDAQGEYLVEQCFKKGCRVKLPRPADRRVPWQLLVQVIAKEVEHVHSHPAVLHQFPVGGDVLEVSRDQQLKKDHGVDRGVAGPAVKFFRILIKETQGEGFAEPSVKIFLWDPVRQLETDEEFFGIVLSSLHTFNLRISAHR
nr:hypothetical protein [Pricia antarctica]